jgi:hypothetical protein
MKWFIGVVRPAQDALAAAGACLLPARSRHERFSYPYISGGNPVRHHVLTSFLLGASALSVLPAASRAQAPSPSSPPPVAATPRVAPSTDARVQAAAVVAPQPRPATPAAVPSAPRQAVTKPPLIQGSSYWGAAKPTQPKKKPSALRRFFNRFGGGSDENYDPEQGVKVTRDMATGRTNVLGSKPWMSPSP